MEYLFLKRKQLKIFTKKKVTRCVIYYNKIKEGYSWFILFEQTGKRAAYDNEMGFKQFLHRRNQQSLDQLMMLVEKNTEAASRLSY